MDNNVRSMEKITFRDIIKAIGEIFSTPKSDVENAINKKLQAVYAVEEEIGAKKGIEGLEKSVTFDVKQNRKRRSPNIKHSDVTVNNIENFEKTINNPENSIELEKD